MHSGTRVSTRSTPASTQSTLVSTQSTPVSTLRSMRFQTAHAEQAAVSTQSTLSHMCFLLGGGGGQEARAGGAAKRRCEHWRPCGSQPVRSAAAAGRGGGCGGSPAGFRIVAFSRRGRSRHGAGRCMARHGWRCIVSPQVRPNRTLYSERSLQHCVSCMLSAACCMLSAACCLLHVACCLLHVACCLLHVAMLSAAFYMLSAARCMLSAACCMLHAACCMLSA